MAQSVSVILKDKFTQIHKRYNDMLTGTKHYIQQIKHLFFSLRTIGNDKNKETHSQDEISPFIQLNGVLIVTEWQLIGDGKGLFHSFQSLFSDHSVN